MKFLFISIAAPPKNDPESLQVGKLLNGMKEASLGVTLITETISNNSSWEAKVQNKLGGKINKRIEMRTHSVFFERLKRRFRFSFYPDDKFLFHKKIKKALRSNSVGFDLIYSRSAPITSTIAAYKLARKFKRPWVLHLSDPWTINPYLNVTKEDKIWEHKCFETAKIITLTNRNVIKLYSEIYPEFSHKFRLFPNLYLDSEVIADKNSEHNEFKIIHTGNLYSFRRPDSFISGFELFIDGLKPEYQSLVQVIFVGNLQEDMVRRVTQSKYSSSFELRKSMPFEKMKDLQQEADLLLSIDAQFDTPDKSLFFPSKLLDYMIAKRPILALTHSGSPTYEFVNKGYGRAFDHDDSTSVALFLKELFVNKVEDRKVFELSTPDKFYSVSENVKVLINLFNEARDDG